MIVDAAHNECQRVKYEKRLKHAAPISFLITAVKGRIDDRIKLPFDYNGFGFSNVNVKLQLLAWLDDFSFLQPKNVIIKAMNIACANNKRRLSYVVGILKNWKNESLLTLEEIDSYHENQRSVPKYRRSNDSFPAGRAIPGGFELDLTAGEE